MIAYEKDFKKSTIAKLANQGIRIIGYQAIPGDGDLPFVNSTRGYKVDDNGTGKIWTFDEVLKKSGD